MNAKTIAWNIAVRRSSPFFARKMLAVVPNVSWGLLPWEADLIVCTKTGYLTEIEIKISISDWKADFLKTKFNVGWKQRNDMIKKFYYAAPLKLAERYVELELPTGSGIIGITDNGQVEILKEAENRSKFRKLKLLETHKLLRLAALKAWNLSHHPTKEPPVKE